MVYNETVMNHLHKMKGVDFMGMMRDIVKAVKKDKPDADLVVKMAKDLKKKFDADKDKVFDLNELMRNSYREKAGAAIQSLRTQLGEDIILTGTWDGAEDMRELDESELLDGEISAFVCKVGSYLVRMAECLYQDSPDGYGYLERKPAGKEAIATYKEKHPPVNNDGYVFACWPNVCNSSCRNAQKVSAQYIGTGSVPSEEWQCVCFADHARSYSWSDNIRFICAVKGGKLSPAGREELYVLKSWMGDSSSWDYWYRFTSDGTIEKYRIYPLMNPFGIEASKEPWGEPCGRQI